MNSPASELLLDDHEAERVDGVNVMNEVDYPDELGVTVIV